MHKRANDEFLQKTAEAQVRKKFHNPCQLRLHTLRLPTVEGTVRACKRALVKTHIDGHTFYATGLFRPELEDSIDEALENLERRIQEFSTLENSNRKEILNFLQGQLGSRDEFEKKQEDDNLSGEEIRALAKELKGYENKWEALERSNILDLGKEIGHA